MSDNRYEYKTLNGKKNRVHRHVMQEHLGRQLESNEFVYHINGNSLDNSIENLVLITKKLKKGD